MALSNPFSVTIAASQLQSAAAALASGASAAFTPGIQTAFDQADLAWQTAFYHDDTNGLIHLMGKPANAATSWKHQYFNVATSTWTVVSAGQWNNDGHIYGNFTMDFVTGDVFQQRSSAGSDNPRRLRWWKYANRASGAAAWTVAPATQDIYSGAMETHANGVCYHPNLYGPGDGGTIWNEQNWLYYWRKSTDAPTRITSGYAGYGDKQGANVYWPFHDAAFVGGSIGRPLARITPNPTVGGTPILTTMNTPPIETAGNSHLGGGGFGSLHVHPVTPSKLLLLETAGSRAWTGTMSGATITWTQIANHPFAQVPRVICSLRGGLGCIWAIGRTDAGVNFSTLWKPAP